ncbi:MAG: hypothetical protein NXH82_12090 [Rhodobacteraceae bacterium]|nr:hypothetical protein [Paracoccaceae bacterium]
MPLLHDLGHFVDYHYKISKLSLLFLQPGPLPANLHPAIWREADPNHRTEHFADFFPLAVQARAARSLSWLLRQTIEPATPIPRRPNVLRRSSTSWTPIKIQWSICSKRPEPRENHPRCVGALSCRTLRPPSTMSCFNDLWKTGSFLGSFLAVAFGRLRQNHQYEQLSSAWDKHQLIVSTGLSRLYLAVGVEPLERAD